MKNKALILLAFSFIFLTNSCKKKNNDDDEQAPTSFTQKVIIEEYTGEWCGYCPDGARILREIKTNNPNKVYPISYHIGDSFQESAGQYYDNLFNQYGYPGGVVQRSSMAGTRSQWDSKATQELTKTPKAGLKIESSLDGDNLNITVKFAGTEDFDSKLSLMIIENDVPESSPGAQSGAAAGYLNPDMFRAVLSDQAGDNVSVKSGEINEKTYSTSISGMNKSKVYIVAFLHNDINGQDKYVLNAQQVKAGSTQDFD